MQRDLRTELRRAIAAQLVIDPWKLVAARLLAGLSQAQLASAAGMSVGGGQTLISRMELGAKERSTDLPAIAAALGVAVEDLQTPRGELKRRK